MGVLTATGLGKRYRRTWALRDCSLTVPAGRVVALVGPNGAGKTTLLHLVVGLLAPTTGTVRVFDREVAGDAETLARVAFLAQDKPLYDGFTVADMLRFGRHLNPRWDQEYAQARLGELDIPLDRKVGRLSGGQQAQVALTVALAKRPDLLVLDEPLANLDPLARHEVMRGLMAAVAETGMTVVLSSHVVSDLENTCDWLVVLNGGRVQVSGDIEELVGAHRLLTGPVELADGVAARLPVVGDTRTDRQATLLARTGGEAVALDPRWTARGIGLEELVLAYLRRPDGRIAAPAGVGEHVVIWLTWRQHRGQLLVTAGFLAVLGTVLLAHSIIMTDQLAGFASDEAGRLGRLASLWGQPEAGNRWFAEFHSADQYWRFQWTEAGILLVATTLLGCALAYRVARRGAST